MQPVQPLRWYNRRAGKVKMANKKIIEQLSKKIEDLEKLLVKTDVKKEEQVEEKTEVKADEKDLKIKELEEQLAKQKSNSETSKIFKDLRDEIKNIEVGKDEEFHSDDFMKKVG